MTNKMKSLSILIAVAILTGFVMLAYAGMHASVENLPAPVQDTILEIVGSNPIQEIEKEVYDGVSVYEVEYTVGGIEHGLKCTEKGDVIELEHVITTDELPAAAFRELRVGFPGVEILEVEAVQLFLYEVELVRNGREFEILLTAAGDFDYDDDDDNEDDDYDTDQDDDDHDDDDDNDDDDDD